MTRAIYFMEQPWLATMTAPPVARGPMTPHGGFVFSRQRLPTDSIGTFALILTNIVVGSVIQVETQAGVAIETRTADAASEAFSIPAYAAGSANNDLRVKVRKGSAAPFYIPWETLSTGFVGSQSIYVSQIPDE